MTGYLLPEESVVLSKFSPPYKLESMITDMYYSQTIKELSVKSGIRAKFKTCIFNPLALVHFY